MFRIECFCDDKKLGDVQRVLSGLIVAPPVVEYVANAIVENGRIVPKVKAGNLAELVLAHFADVPRFNRNDVRKLLVENNFQESTAGYITQKLRELKYIRTVKGQRGTYEHVVMTPATKAAIKSTTKSATKK